MNFKRPNLLPFTSVFFFLHTQAQIKLPINSGLRTDVEKVVADFPHQFASLRGDEVADNPQTVEYTSLLKIDKAEECTIIKYSANKKPMYSWHAVMLSTEEFSEAAKKYKWIFNQLKGMNVSYVVDRYTLQGSFDAPEESRSFVSSVLAPDHAPSPLQKLKIEVSMRFEFPEWKVMLDVYEKERDDNEQGDVNE